MKLKLIAILLIIAVFLTACGYIVVEEPNRQSIGSIFIQSAHAEQPQDAPAERAQPTIVIHASESEPSEDVPAPPTPPIQITRGEGAVLATPDAATPDAATPDAPDGDKDEVTQEIEKPPLKRGAKGEEVLKLQNQLRVYGFLNGKADGDFGVQTENAVKLAQSYLRAQQLEEAKRARAEMLKRVNEMTASIVENLNALMPRAAATDASAGEAAPPTPVTIKQLDMKLVSATRKHKSEPDNFVADGVVTDELQMYLDNAFDVYVGDLKQGSAGADVVRLQTRLNNMYYLLGGIDGEYGPNTQAAIKYYQKFNGLEQTGIADEKLQRALFSKDCKLSDYPMFEYKVEISISKQKVYIYRWNAGAYSKLVKTMICSTGTKEDPTPLGTFKLAGPCGRWYYFKEFECWAQYAYRIYSGILFHSVLYSEKDTSTLRQGSVNALGSRASHGCVRLKVADAKWLYENIPAGTTCRIYN